MIHQHENIYIKENNLPEGFSELLKKILTEINIELNKIAIAFYSYETEDDGFKAFDNLFPVIERTWVGIFNNALIRCEPQTTVLQEFKVLHGDKYYGRCDLLFTFDNGKNIVNILVEAKCYKFRNDWEKNNDEQFYTKILNRANDYYTIEKEYYAEKKVWLMSLVFEWIADEKQLESAKEIIKSWNDLNDTETDFIALYFGERRGVFVYGKLINAANFKSL